MNKVLGWGLRCLVVIGVIAGSTLYAVSQEEKDQCLYVKQAFLQKERELSSVVNIFGEFLHDYATLLAAPVGAAASLQSAVLFSHKRYFGLNRSLNFLACGVIAGTITSYLMYRINKIMGTWLKDQPEMCKNILLSYADEWEIHKSHTPSAWHGIFEGLIKPDERTEFIQGHEENPEVAMMLVNYMLFNATYIEHFSGA